MSIIKLMAPRFAQMSAGLLTSGALLLAVTSPASAAKKSAKKSSASSSSSVTASSAASPSSTASKGDAEKSKDGEGDPTEEDATGASLGDDDSEPEEADAEVSPAGGSAGPSCAPPKPSRYVMFLETGFRYDLGTLSRTQQSGAIEENLDEDISSWGVPLQVGFLSRLDDNWRMGGAFGYGFNYDANNNNLLLGQLLTLDMRLEWTTPLAGGFWLLAGPRAGLSSIIPGGVLQQQIESNQSMGYGTISGPRLGFLVGADIGARYEVTSWFYLRSTLGYTYTMNFLLNSGASGGGFSASSVWVASASRLTGTIGAEVAF